MEYISRCDYCAGRRRPSVHICWLVALLLCLVGLTSCQVAATDDPILTPWWPLTYSEGETLEVDCGTYTGGRHQDVILHWRDPSGETMDSDGT